MAVAVPVLKTDTFEIQRQKINDMVAYLNGTSPVNIIYVTKQGDDANDGLTEATAKATIEGALAVVDIDNITIKVYPGVYVENNPLVLPDQVSIIGTSLREVTVTPANSPGDLFYVRNGCYIANMSFVGSSNTGAMISFNPNDPPYIDQSPYIQNCTNFVPDSIGLKVDGDDAIGPLKSMVVDSYTQYNANGIGASICNESYAQLVSMFTICTDKAIECFNGGSCDLTNSNSSFGNYGLVADGVSDLKYTGSVSLATTADADTVRVDISTTSFSISSATYDNVTGLLTATTTANHGFQVGMDVKVENLIFSCTSGGSTSNQAFPSGAYGYIFNVESTPAANQFVVNVGTSDIVHTYQNGGTAQVNNVRPFDGQVVYFDTLYYELLRIDITNGGSGYTSVPNVTIGTQSEAWGINAEAIAEVTNGVVTAIDIVSTGRGYSVTPPSITIDPPTSGVTATADAVMVPSYFIVSESTEVSTDVYDVTFVNEIPLALSISDTCYFYKQSRLLASSHAFQQIGSGTNITTAVPQNGGITIQENETVSINGGIVVYTSTDQSGNFRIGDGVVINQSTGTVSGEAYTKSLFSTVTPFILALGG